jgi:SprT-like family
MPAFQTYIDLDINQEWKLVNMETNVQQMFDKMKDQFANNFLKTVKYSIKWDSTGVISDDASFKFFETHKQVLISTKAMTRPRVQLVSMLLHILIHIYINFRSNGSIKINLHDDNFREIMLFLNKTMNTQISVRQTDKLEETHQILFYVLF